MNFHNEDPNQLAETLIGKSLVINGVLAKILEVKVRDEAHCQGFRKRPILRLENPPAASAEPYGNTVPFFIRTAGQTCIQIETVEIRDKHYKGAGAVGSVLRLTEKGTANLMVLETDYMLVIWDD